MVIKAVCDASYEKWKLKICCCLTVTFHVRQCHLLQLYYSTFSLKYEKLQALLSVMHSHLCSTLSTSHTPHRCFWKSLMPAFGRKLEENQSRAEKHEFVLLSWAWSNTFHWLSLKHESMSLISYELLLPVSLLDIWEYAGKLPPKMSLFETENYRTKILCTSQQATKQRNKGAWMI